MMTSRLLAPPLHIQLNIRDKALIGRLTDRISRSRTVYKLARDQIKFPIVVKHKTYLATLLLR